MNRLIVAKGVGKYFIKKSIPSKYREQYINSLLEDERIRLSNKFRILLDKAVMEKLKDYWKSILEPDIRKKHFREKYGINIEHHIKYFDPSGKTLGCGCSLCGILHRIKTKERNLNTLKSALKFIDTIMKIKDKSDICNLDFRTFYGKDNSHVLNFDGQSFINKTEDQLIKNKEDLLTREIELESKLRGEKETINVLSKLTGIPIKIENAERIWKKINFSKNKKALADNKAIDTLSLDECLNLTSTLGLYNIDRKQLKNIRKELNRKSEKYTIATHLHTQTHDVYIPLLNKRVSLPKRLKVNKIVNEITHDVSKQHAKETLDNIHNLTRKLLKNYQSKILKEELNRSI